MDIKKLIKEAHGNAVERGFYDCPDCHGAKEVVYEYLSDGNDMCDCEKCNGTGIDPNRNIGELLMLIVSELSEALEAHRCGKFAKKTWLAQWSEYYNRGGQWLEFANNVFRQQIKDTFEDEIADVFIRLFDLCGYLEIEPDDQPNGMDFSNWNIGESLCYITQQVVQLRGCEKNMFYYNVIIYCLLGFCQAHNIQIEKHIEAKMAYNRTRPHKHGKDY